TFTANTTLGSYFLIASVSDSSGTFTAPFTLTNTVGVPATISIVAGSGQSANINTAFAAPLKATVKDAANHPISGATVNFTAPASGASGAFVGGIRATAITAASGIATAPAFTANSTTGVYSVIASVNGVASSASFSLTNNRGSASTAVSSSSSTSVSGQSVT